MSTLLPAGLPFPQMMPGFGAMPPISSAVTSPSGSDMQKMAAAVSAAQQSQSAAASPLMSAASKTSEPQFTFNNGGPQASSHQNKHKEKYACKYCGKVRIIHPPLSHSIDD